MKKYKGSCHCQAVTYEVETENDFTEGMSCNCSHCQRKGFLLAFVEVDKFKLLSGADNLTTYHFNKHLIDHTFCKTCGVESFAKGEDGKGHTMYMVNLNCLEDFDITAIKVNDFDGRSI